MMKIFLTGCLVLTLTAGVAWAQDADYAERKALAEKLNVANPVSRMMENSILRVGAEWGLAEKEKFQREMMATVDVPGLEKVSLEALVDTFTKEELQVMLAYYSAPEAAKIAEKMPVYQGLLQPALSKEIDRALMKLRTGYETQSSPAPEQ